MGLRQGYPQPTVTLQNQLTQRRSNRDRPNQSSPWLAVGFQHQNPRGEGRVAVLGFKTRRNSNQLTVSQDLARSCNYLTKSRLDLDGSGLILALVTKPEINRYNLTPDETQTSQSNKSSRSFWFTFLSTQSFQVKSGLRTNTTRPDPWTALLGIMYGNLWTM